MNLIPGSAEPKLRPLQAELSGWLKSIHAAANPERIRQVVQALPGPRSRLFDPDAMLAADELILHSFQECDWKAERVPFAFDHVEGALDPLDRVDDQKTVLYDHLEGANIIATRLYRLDT